MKRIIKALTVEFDCGLAEKENFFSQYLESLFIRKTRMTVCRMIAADMGFDLFVEVHSIL